MGLEMTVTVNGQPREIPAGLNVAFELAIPSSPVVFKEPGAKLRNLLGSPNAQLQRRHRARRGVDRCKLKSDRSSPLLFDYLPVRVLSNNLPVSKLVVIAAADSDRDSIRCGAGQ